MTHTVTYLQTWRRCFTTRALSIPAACSLTLCCTQRGACPHRLAGSLLLLLGALEALTALALDALALTAGSSTRPRPVW